MTYELLQLCQSSYQTGRSLYHSRQESYSQIKLSFGCFTRVDTELDLLVLPLGYTLQVQEYLQ